MKRVFLVALALMLCGAGISLRSGRMAGAAPPQTPQAADPFHSEEALRHQMDVPHHWRALVMVQN